MSTPNAALLPVAGGAEVKAYAASLIRKQGRAATGVLALYSLAGFAGLAGPRLLGEIVGAVQHGTTRAHIDRIAMILAGFVVAQAILVRLARYASSVIAEGIFADLREEFLRKVISLPLSTVERAGTGDLLTRMTSDIDAMSRSVRFAMPETMIAVATAVLTLLAAFITAPLVALPCLLVFPLLFVATRWYLKRAPQGYLRERRVYSRMFAGITETLEGGRTIDAMRLRDKRIRRGNDDVRHAYVAERYTLRLRTVWFPSTEAAYVVPVVGSLLVGGLLAMHGHASLAQVTTVTLYFQQLVDPVDRLLGWLDELQVGASSLARLVGVGRVPADRTPTGAEPDGEQLRATGLHFAYRTGRDVLHGVDLDVRPGERIAMVGPSGAGKSTLGRLLAGIHGPGDGSVTVGGVPLVDLEIERLRREVALVTQEHHVFVGTVADNLRLAKPSADDGRLRSVLSSIDALDWVTALPEGLETMVGSGGHILTPAQAQQIALARLVLADPHTLVLDEATSLLDPRAARRLERSLAAVVEGRTVIAIAHRLHTAHDADRVAVVVGGRIVELGSHDELIAEGGSYASLWASWHGTAASPDAEVGAASQNLDSTGRRAPRHSTLAT
jgi:ABC-type multidrug transport system fused ATPase/permease subunit